MTAKWGGAYWADLGERVGASAVGGALTLPVLQAVPDVPMSARLVWAVVGIPAVTSLLKGLLVNLKGGAPTASVVDVISDGEG